MSKQKFNIGDTVQAPETIRKHWELVMRKNQKGIVTGFTTIYGYISGNKPTDGVTLELSNGKSVAVPIDWVVPYKK